MVHNLRELNLLQNIDDDVKQLTEGITQCRKLDAEISELEAKVIGTTEKGSKKLDALRKEYVEFKDKFEDLVFCSMRYWGHRETGLKNWSEYSGIDLCLFASGTITYLGSLREHILDFPELQIVELK